MSKLRWILSRIRRKLWIRVALYAALGVLAAGLASLATRFLPWSMPINVTSDAIDSLLTVIASSMLAVTTFSIGSLLTAYGSATSNGTPRATVLLTEDEVVQSALATFVGSFLFSIVGLTASKVSAYGPQGRAVLFLVTLAVILMIVLALLRWINQLTRLGRVGDTVTRLEDATFRAMQVRLEHPYLDARPAPARSPQPGAGAEVPARQVGYVQHVDTGALAKLCDEHELAIAVRVLPGGFVYEHTPLALIHGGPQPLPEDLPEDLADELADAIRAAITLGKTRSFDQDPRFGLVTLSEVALRALSPAVNDPGTAIDVIGRQTRLLSYWGRGWDEAAGVTPRHERVTVPPLEYGDMFDDAFNQIARDAAGQVDVMLRLLKALAALTQIGPPEARRAAQHQLQLAYERGMQDLPIEADRKRLTGVYEAARSESALGQG
ncbi:Uncharacterized membrane protein [Paracoccus halophilus]|uniref:Uncharacterized membrane protein n=1 Tax=Paracoccus halophilus TaxID=376733 RepID=A0A099EYP0_9RHOB|nr:DUF2254 domain-containing protein [Paracoccus halophilus]KGJ03083.1 hypothetical protein IT41_15335 [Paracoccus halophilus]SFA53108.1 Uncharacterized membrane protein [Paracoccus halophilus]